MKNKDMIRVNVNDPYSAHRSRYKGICDSYSKFRYLISGKDRNEDDWVYWVAHEEWRQEK